MTMDDSPQPTRLEQRTEFVRYSYYKERVVDGVYRWEFALIDVVDEERKS